MYKKNLKLLILYFLFLSFLILLPVSSNILAQSIENPIAANTFAELFLAIANFVANMAIFIATIMIIVAGFQYMFAGGSEDKVKTANRTVLWSVVGLIIALLSKGILVQILDIFEVPSPF